MLATRPWLQADRGAVDILNALDGWWYPGPVALEPDAYNEKASHLLSRCVWNVAALTRPGPDDRVTRDDVVFCEDTSWFEPFDATKSFRSDLEGSYAQRYVRKLPNIEYSPRPRLFEA
jgi:hypothetical protein